MPTVNLASPPERPGQARAFAESTSTQRPRTLTPGDAELVTFEGIVETKDVCRKAWVFAPSAVPMIPRERVRCEGEAEHTPRFTT